MAERRDRGALLRFTTMTGELVKVMRACPQPIVAAIDGVCAGAGAILAMASDMRIGTARSRVGFLFVRVGLSGADMGACALLPRIRGAYEHAYYAGIICERKASAVWQRALAGSGPRVYDWLREAMEHYEVAESLRPPGNDDALLRWNTCARMIMENPQLHPVPEERTVLQLE